MLRFLVCIKSLVKAFIEALSEEEESYYIPDCVYEPIKIPTKVKVAKFKVEVKMFEPLEKLKALPIGECSNGQKVVVEEDEVEKWFRDNPELRKLNGV